MAIEWNPEFKDVENIKNDVIQGMEEQGMSKTMLYHEIDQLEEKSKKDLKHREEEVKSDSNQWSEQPHASVDAQGYINDHYHEKIYSESHAESDAFFQKHKRFIYNYEDGISTLEIMKEEEPTLSDAVDNALEDIQKTDDELLKKEVTSDYNLDAQNSEFKDDKDLEKYPEKYQNIYKEYIRGYESDDKTAENIKVVKMGDMTFDYSKLKDERLKDFLMLDATVSLDAQFKNDETLNIYSNVEEKNEFNQYAYNNGHASKTKDVTLLDMSVGDYMEFAIDKKNGVSHSKNIDQHIDKRLQSENEVPKKRFNKKNNIEL